MFADNLVGVVWNDMFVGTSLAFGAVAGSKVPTNRPIGIHVIAELISQEIVEREMEVVCVWMNYTHDSLG